MHDTALEIGRLFFEVYLGGRRGLRILDVGARDINGSLRRYAPEGSAYTGVDVEPGEGVDLVLDDPHAFPFPAGQFDATIGTSTFEHDQMFWLTFLEMVRVTKTGGFIYINAPSNGDYHRYPCDNWRFYPDAAQALAAWAVRQGAIVTLSESFIAPRRGDQWNDCVMVFAKGLPPEDAGERVADRIPGAFNVRRSADAAPENPTEQPQDRLLLAELADRLAAREREIAAMRAQLQGSTAKAGAPDDPLPSADSDARFAVLEAIIGHFVLNETVERMANAGRAKAREKIVAAAAAVQQAGPVPVEALRRAALRLIPDIPDEGGRKRSATERPAQRLQPFRL